jgi:hypothetical protein
VRARVAEEAVSLTGSTSRLVFAAGVFFGRPPRLKTGAGTNAQALQRLALPAPITCCGTNKSSDKRATQWPAGTRGSSSKMQGANLQVGALR